MRCANCGCTNITCNTQPTSGYNLARMLFINANKTYHCMACGQIGNSSWTVMDYETEFVIETALRRNDVA